jgi:hypothetical protein
MPTRKSKRVNKPKPNIDVLTSRFGVSTELLEAAENVEVTMTLREWLEWQADRQKSYVIWTDSGIEYVVRGYIRLRKRHAVGGTIITLLTVVGHEIYVRFDTITRFFTR